MSLKYDELRLALSDLYHQNSSLSQEEYNLLEEAITIAESVKKSDPLSQAVIGEVPGEKDPIVMISDLPNKISRIKSLYERTGIKNVRVVNLYPVPEVI